jgi:hypothetical protein
MAVVFRKKEVGVTDTSVSANVPDNDTARLMYYLDSMCTVLGLETTGYDIAKLTDYKNHRVLTNNEKVKLFALCGYLSPDVLNNKCIIHSDELCGDSPNRFFRFNSKETAFVAAESVFIGASKVSVKKIMAYKMSWMRRNYINPMTRGINRNTGERDNQRTINYRSAIQTRTITPPVRRNTTRNNANWIYSSNSSSLDCCVIS